LLRSLVHIPYNGKRFAGAVRRLYKPGQNLELMPLAGLSIRCSHKRTVDPHYHLLSWLGNNLRIIDLIKDLLFNASAYSERSVTRRGIIETVRFWQLDDMEARPRA
jgi:hypothetical protein